MSPDLILRRTGHHPTAPQLKAAIACIEDLEPRRLLSAVGIAGHARPHHSAPHHATVLAHALRRPKKDHGGDNQGNGGGNSDQGGHGHHGGDGGGDNSGGDGSNGGNGDQGGDGNGNGNGKGHGHGHGHGGDGNPQGPPSTPPPTTGGGDGGSGSGDSPAPTTAPTATISAPDITAGGASTEVITVTYSDTVDITAPSIRTANISVTGPTGSLAIMAAQITGSTASTLTADYTVAAPHGTWSNSDNGSYTVALKANQVTDANGGFAGGASASFSVNIPAPVSTTPTDNSFGNGQPVSIPFTTEAILTQPDGKLIAVGHEGNVAAGTSQGVIERFNLDGSLDASFGSGGRIVSPAGANEAYYAVVLEDANHFLVAGTRGGDFLIARYTLDGKLDTSFGSGGRVVTDFGTNADAVRGLAIAPGGLIVAAGDAGGNFAFARYDSAGHLDPNFAQSGRQLFGLGTGANGMGNVVVQSDGRIVAAGAEGSKVVVVRLTATGEADGNFGTGGLVTVAPLVTNPGSTAADRSEGLALQSNGRILVANRTSTGHFGLVRLTATGALDSTFGVAGLATANFGGDDDADSIAIENTGEIIVVGTSLQNGTANTAVAAFSPDGALLTTFANKGLLALPSGVTPASRELHVGDIVLRAFAARMPDGRVVVGTTDDAVAATTSSTLRRLIVPGATVVNSADAGTLLGNFGIVNGKRTNLAVTDPDGTRITLSLAGGTGTAYQLNGKLHLVIDDMTRGVTLAIIGSGGDGRVSLADVQISGTLRTLNARNSDLFGTLHVTGGIGRLTLGKISGTVFSGDSIAAVNAGDLAGNLYATGAIGRARFANVSGTIASGSGIIGSVSAQSLDAARILSGADLGADGAPGGTGANADSYAAGAIGSIRVLGTIVSSFIGAGIDPVDQTFGNSNDKGIGGASSAIRFIAAKSADQASRFEAGAFGTVRLGGPVNPLTDSRFKVL